ncbi:hypothetical protein NMG60_11020359 [Bertholletia excelsa]
MITGNKIDMLSDMNGRRESNVNLEDTLRNELEKMLQQQHNQDIIDRERDLNIFRSGSAPPTVEGSLSAVGSLFRNPDFMQADNRSSDVNAMLTEEEIRSHPAYLSYYYSHENLNPRLPPPLLSREYWRVAQRFQAGGSSFGGIGDWRRKDLIDDDGSSSLFSTQPSLSVHKVEDELMELRKATPRNMPKSSSTEWMDRGCDGLIGLSTTGMGARRKSFADILQEGLDQHTLSGRISHSASRSSFGEVDPMRISSHQSAELCNRLESSDSLHHGETSSSLPRVQSFGSPCSHSFVSTVAAPLLRSGTPEPQLIGRLQTPGLPPVGSRLARNEKKGVLSSSIMNGLSSSMTELADIAALSSLSLSKNQLSHDDSDLQSKLQLGYDKPNQLLDTSNGPKPNLRQPLNEKSKAEKLTTPASYADLKRNNEVVAGRNVSNLGLDGRRNFSQRLSSPGDLYSKRNSSGFVSGDNISSVDFSDQGPSGYSGSITGNATTVDHLGKGSTSTSGGNAQYLSISSKEAGPGLHLPHVDPRFIQYLQNATEYAVQASAYLGDPSQGRNYFSSSLPYGELQLFQKAYLETLLAQQKNQFVTPLLHKTSGLNHGYCVNPALGISMPYHGNTTTKPVISSRGSGGQALQTEWISQFYSMMRNPMGGSSGTWNSDGGTNTEGALAPSLLEEFKNSKNRSFELSGIVGNVVEFSMDQYGSRFIQQKLETATVEEKTKIFPEIIPHARALMTDVFGNYVIQKFFEHGTESQRKELACQLTGHVLPLSLQMYGCRVIQKALEVVDVQQQTQMVAELDGYIIKCVRDQNGNHVIQKCIECVPQDRIQFIISAFFGQVAALSSHPYGCRVIQRVLEHCDDPKTQQPIMEEIMQFVCNLAQDQYGNYVIQHVLQHGKPHERSDIIHKLAGHIVKMSQQKFASNVVEKCLTFGSTEDRQLLVSEMLGTTDENEPLQAMMKDPFGNYVVQKVIETCDDKSRELILSCIKAHLNALKRYTYGKHIVSRIEKLLTAGERRVGLASSYAA